MVALLPMEALLWADDDATAPLTAAREGLPVPGSAWRPWAVSSGVG